MTTWFGALRMTKVRCGRWTVTALATSFAILALPAHAGAQRVEPAAVLASAQQSGESLSAPQRQDVRDRCRTRYIVSNAIGGGLLAYFLIGMIPVITMDPQFPKVQLLAISAGAGIGALNGRRKARERCRPR